ncbi:Retrovirus-related Pol polyprotein from transposon [Trichinella nelsoni]|uniref:Retrovirus-related Pol polyprotein from transposon n=1 Tax=Trichinella nelsoni TaxID=6336 RepID=A0A0V0RP37_9BILA|nr:Retrovirus-related Pol polyprotein from transposon [Trichinella nelsoni]
MDAPITWWKKRTSLLEAAARYITIELDEFKMKLLDTAVNCTCKSSAYFRYYALVAGANRANNSIPPDNVAEEGEATLSRLGLEDQREMALRVAAAACYCPPPSFSLEMDLTEWMDMVEDFIFVSGVPTSRQAASARLLMTVALKRCLLTAYGQSESLIRLEMRFRGLRQRKAGKSESKLVSHFILSLASKELHRELCQWELATLTKARQLAERVTEIEEGWRRTVDNAASGNGRLTCNPHGGQWSASSAVAWATFDETIPSYGPEPGRRVLRPLQYRSQHGASPPMGAAKGSILLGEGRKVPLCGHGMSSLQIRNWRGHIHVAVVESLVIPGILGTNFFNQFVKVIDWQAREMTMTDGSRLRIVRKPAQAACPSIECAWITPGPWEVPLEETGKRALSGVLRRCGKAISRGETDLRRKNLVQHHIETAGARPVKQPPRPLPQSQRAVMDQLIHEMLRSRLNAVRRIDAQPIPRIDDILDALAGARWFSTLDLASGYWLVEFRVMPFGLCNALPTFQRLMETALRGLTSKTCLVYLDNIIVFGRTEEEHLERLEEVLSRLRAVGLKVKPGKCQLMRRSVQYLCHTVTQHGIGTDLEKTVADPGDSGRHAQPPIRGPPGCDEDAGKGTPAILLASATGRRRGLVQGMPDVRCTGGADKEAPGPYASPSGRLPYPTICDHFSKWAKAFALPNAEARTVATALVNGIFCHYGVPVTLYSDQDLLAKASIDHPDDWDAHLDKVLLAYQSIVHNVCTREQPTHTTSATPSQIVFSRELRPPVDLVYGLLRDMPEQSVGEYTQRLRQDLEQLYETVRGRAGREQGRQKFWRDRKAHGPVYKPGDRVWMQVPTKTELGAYWDSPYEVQKKLDWNTYCVEKKGGGGQRLVVHFDCLNVYHDRQQNAETWGVGRKKRSTLHTLTTLYTT